MSVFSSTTLRRVPPADHAWVCLGVALCAASPVAARAQESTINTRIYACVDPTDASARRKLQDEPCKLPMYQLPVTPDRTLNPSRPWPTYPPRSPEADGAHPMFWRFPVQTGGPYEVPRHSRR